MAWCSFLRPQREPVVVMIKLISRRLRLLDAPRYQWTRMHACETAVRFNMVDLSLDGVVLCTRQKRRSMEQCTAAACVTFAGRFLANL